MSRSGVAVTFEQVRVSDVRLAVGETVRLVIDLPHSANISPRYLECMVRVVRVTEVGTDSASAAFGVHRIWVRGQ